MSILSLSYYQSDITITNILQNLPHIMAEKNRWHRYGMKKLHHCNTWCSW